MVLGIKSLLSMMATNEQTISSCHSKHTENILSHCHHKTRKKGFGGLSQLFWECSRKKEQFLLFCT